MQKKCIYKPKCLSLSTWLNKLHQYEPILNYQDEKSHCRILIDIGQYVKGRRVNIKPHIILTQQENVLVSQGYHNKSPQIGWLKTEIYSLTVLKARSPKSVCWQGQLLPKALNENPFHASLPAGGCWQPLVFLGSSPHHSSLGLLSGHAPPCGSSPLLKIPATGFRAHPNLV